MNSLSHQQVLDLLPHRPPMLMVDTVTELVPGEQAVGHWRVPEDAFWREGHFPHEPLLPGVLLVEALAQVCALVYLSHVPERAGASVYLVGVEGTRLRRPVRPGETLTLRVQVEDKRRLWRFQTAATCGVERCAEATLLATVARGGGGA